MQPQLRPKLQACLRVRRRVLQQRVPAGSRGLQERNREKSDEGFRRKMQTR
jgi:hypothetical protein